MSTTAVTVDRSVDLSVDLSVYLSVYLSIDLSVYLSISRRDGFVFWSLRCSRVVDRPRSFLESRSPEAA